MNEVQFEEYGVLIDEWEEEEEEEEEEEDEEEEEKKGEGDLKGEKKEKG